MVSRLKGRDGRDRREGFEGLCRRYWRPLYLYVRIAWARTNEDAKDLTQEFLLHLIEGDAIREYRRERGSLRAYLKGLLRGFLQNDRRTSLRLKRGGDATVLPLEDGDLPDARCADPDVAMDRAWAVELSRHAIARVRDRWTAAGRAGAFRIYEEHDLSSGEKPGYAELAERHGVKEGDVRNYLFAAREEILQEIRAELAATTSDPAGLEAEWNALFGP
jgi:DNA-directed RNA polymerase specialized sigma24 family protein